MRNSVIFLCTGNICRSPMGEALLKDAVKKLPDESPLKKLRIISAGTFGEDGMGATLNSIRALEQVGVKFEGHVAQSISKEMLDSCYCLVAMTRNHLDTVKSRYKESMPPHAFTLLSINPKAKNKDVVDPWGYDMGMYVKVRDEIADSIPYLVEYLQKSLAQ